MTTMYDSTNPAAIPEDAEAVLYPVNGKYAWSSEDLERFPTELKVPYQIFIPGAPFPGKLAPWLDLEAADAATRPGLQAAVQFVREGGVGIYTSKDSQAGVEAALKDAGLSVLWGLAEWTGEAHLIPGTAFTQYANPPHSGGDYDLSEVAPDVDLLGPEPAPAPAPAPAPGPGPVPPNPTPPGGFDMAQLPELQEGATGDVVKTVQAILNAKGGAGLAVDGQFGPTTKLKVQEWQDIFHLAADGIVGPQTWSSLLLL